MSRFSGPQHKGALREFKTEQRKKNEANEAAYREWDEAYWRRVKIREESIGPMSPADRLLASIFGPDMYYQGLGEKIPVE